jgi:hypothetical protein
MFVGVMLGFLPPSSLEQSDYINMFFHNVYAIILMACNQSFSTHGVHG